MLPIVKAADDDTCQIVYHYYFLEEENAWIDSSYTAKSDNSTIQVGTNHTSDSNGDKADNQDITIVQRAYTSQYAVHFGITENSYSMTDNIFPANNPYIKINGAYYGNGVGVALGNGDEYNISSKKTYNKKTDLTMVSEAEFYNYQIPDGYERKSSKVYAWDDEDWNIFAQMYVDGIKAANKGTLEAKDLVHNASDKDFYFVHFGWRNNSSTDDNYFSGQRVGDLDLKSSDGADSTTDIFKKWSEDTDISKSIKNSTEAQKVLKEMKAASFDIPSVIGVQNSSDLGNPDLNEIVTLTIRREYGDLDINDITPWEVSADSGAIKRDSSNPLHNAAITLGDTYHWYFFPKKLDVTFEGSGDVCTLDTGIGNDAGTEPGSGETNNKYGVASYAIIGTLLVGAASAYIYAR